MLNQKQFIYPYTFENRAPCVFDRVIFIPSYYFEHQVFEMPSFSSEELFHNTNPVHVEFCSGNGEWIVQKAIENPDINWIACEIKFYRVRKIWVKMKQLNLKNLIIAFGDANDFAKFYLKDGSIEAIHINFPDPWPKEKHAKNRLIQELFVKEMKRILKGSGDVTIVTDHVDYSHQVLDEMGKQFSFSYPSPHYIHQNIDYGSSYFYRLFESRGKEIRKMQFKVV